ncbi:Protein of unknown function [Agrococcus baldri]|uniref:DUF1700 domain-containing protein n=1 Tax=Agrococcus baldri TaxID=153730 RepID=A0AA94HNU9_9MICO|nr:DUF1700 domain-containing protein [Agrococcus baldri]SFS16535.1 Protein of unknown function [Agrococcus baldri]
MTEATALPPAAQHYLEQLRLESARLPRADRQQLLGQISEHLGEAAGEGSEIDDVLARLGSPRELVAEAGAETAEQAPAPRRPSAMLWLAAAAIVVGALMLLWGGSLMLVTGRGRTLLLAVPGAVLAATGVVLLVRRLRSGDDDPATAQARRRIARTLSIAAIAAGALLLILSGALVLLTGRGRSLLIAIPGIVLAIGGSIALLLTARRPERSGVQRGRI